MGIIYDQLRISDDGQYMFIDAHVSQASCFENVNISKITICTEDQVSELDSPESYGDTYIYQQEFSQDPERISVSHYSKTEMLSSEEVCDRITKSEKDNGSLPIDVEIGEGTSNGALNFILSGKYPELTTGRTPKLIVANGTFDPDAYSVDNIIQEVQGTLYEDIELNIWQFRGEMVPVGDNEVLYLYLYKQNSQGGFEYVRIDSAKDKENDVYDYNYLHFLWNFYSETTENAKREIHLVLSKASFNEAFNNTNQGEQGNPPTPKNSDKPIATKEFSGNDLSHNMFFVYTEWEGTPAWDCPCTYDESKTLAVTFDYGVFFNAAMNYTKELGNRCKIPGNFIDFIMNYEALKLSIETDHWIPAINYWKNLMGMNNAIGETTKPCGCHG